jgi:ketosteroid isomerase-like protein
VIKLNVRPKNNAKGMIRTCILPLLALAVFFVGSPTALAQSEHEDAVKGLVERFLSAVGEGDADALSDMFASDANIGTASLRDGQWVTSTMAFEKWQQALRSRTTWQRFREPVTEFTVHVEDGQMAFVKADATVFVDNQAVSHNIDYFTLVREDGVWKFLSASYISKPIATD